MKEKRVFSINGIIAVGYPQAKNKTKQNTNRQKTYLNLNLRGWNVKYKAIKRTEKKKENTEIRAKRSAFSLDTKAWSIKGKFVKLDLIKFKNFYSAKHSVKKMKCKL